MEGETNLYINFKHDLLRVDSICAFCLLHGVNQPSELRKPIRCDVREWEVELCHLEIFGNGAYKLDCAALRCMRAMKTVAIEIKPTGGQQQISFKREAVTTECLMPMLKKF